MNGPADWPAGHPRTGAALPDLVGRGWAFPGAISVTGGVQLIGGHHDIDAAIRVILGTIPGERLMRPEFGCRIWEYVFDPMTATTMGAIEHATREALLRWEPRIDLGRVSAVPRVESGVVDVEIEYRITATNDHRNLVYPFYVIPREVR